MCIHIRLLVPSDAGVERAPGVPDERAPHGSAPEDVSATAMAAAVAAARESDLQRKLTPEQVRDVLGPADQDELMAFIAAASMLRCSVAAAQTAFEEEIDAWCAECDVAGRRLRAGVMPVVDHNGFVERTVGNVLAH